MTTSSSYFFLFLEISPTFGANRDIWVSLGTHRESRDTGAESVGYIGGTTGGRLGVESVGYIGGTTGGRLGVLGLNLSGI